jgi:hypothetical protein
VVGDAVGNAVGTGVGDTVGGASFEQSKCRAKNSPRPSSLKGAISMT